MKNTLLIVSIFLSTFFVKAQDLKNYIPDNASFIVKINGNRINNNVNFDEIRASDLYKDFIFKMLNKKTAEERAIIKLFETPDETGLNIKSEMYVYSIPEEVKSKSKKEEDDYYAPKMRSTTVVAIPLLNSKHFSSFIQDIFKSNSNVKVMKAGKGMYFIKKNSTLIIWNTQNVFFCTLPYRGYYEKEYSKSEIKSVIKTIANPLASTKSIVSNTKVLNALGFDSDLAYIFNSNAWSDMPWLYEEINREDAIKDSTLINKDLFKDNYSFSYINFENGKVVFTGNQFYGEKLAAILNPIFNLKPSPQLANILYQTPVTSYISYAFSLTEVQKFVDKTFNYNMDTLLIEYVRESQENVFDTDSLVVSYKSEIDTIDFLVNGPDDDAPETDWSTITDSGTVYSDSDNASVDYYSGDYDSDQAKYEHETLNWYQLDSLEARQDTLYEMIYDRKDTLAKKMYQSLGIKGEELWHIFNGEFMVLYHAMTTMDKKYKVYEMDAEFNYIEVEKTKKIPMPLYSFAMTINSNELFNKYLKLMIQKGFIQKEKTRYLVVLGEMNQYIWVHEGVCIITNDNNFNPSKRTSSTTKSDYEVDNYNRITTHQSGAYIEIGKILGSSVQFTEEKEVAEILEILAKYFDELVYITDFDKNANVSTKTDVVFNDEKKNSINIIYEMINEMYVHFSKK